MKPIVVIGDGNVAEELREILKVEGYRVHSYFRTTKHSRGNFVSFLNKHKARAVGVCISNQDTEGQAELQYLLDALKLGIPVVTCAKSAVA